jgi:hypothetical protein
MYIWNEDFLADWTSGLGVAVAESVDEARALLLAKAPDYWKRWVAEALEREPDQIQEIPSATYISGGS